MKETENNVIIEGGTLTPDVLSALIEDKRYSEFKSISELLPAVDIAEALTLLPAERAMPAFRLLSKEVAADVFSELDSDIQQRVVELCSDTELSSMLDELYIDDTVDLIEEMPANMVKRILRASTHENRAQINRLLRYPEDSAGTVMTTEYVRFKKHMTVREALAHIREVAIDKETIYTCYVTDEKRHLTGIVTAKDLLISELDAELSEIMETSVISVKTVDDREDVALKFKKYGFIALPVVDNEDRLVGIITVDDVINVINEEVEEDFAKMAAMTPVETPYIRASVFSIWLSRIPWLLLLMISATFSSAILGKFEAALPAVLIIFVPMLMDTGGNSGGQSSVTVIRALSMGELALGDIFRVVWKELRIGFFCGITLAAVSFGKVMLVDRLIMGNTAVTPWVSFAVSLTLLLTIMMAKLIGSTLPLLAKRVGFDPAVMASPLITTIVDALALLLYFFIAANLI